MLTIPPNYRSPLSLRETQIAIKQLKDFYERALAEALCLTRVSAPLFLLTDTGLNDDLNGRDRPVAFEIKAIPHREASIVQSLAKWKRAALARYHFAPGEGLYTDMNAIRRDEDNLDNLHSVYVDQWDWELIITKEQRTPETLKEVVERIFGVFKRTEGYIRGLYPQLPALLPEKVTFLSSQELLDIYPGLTAKEREDAACRRYGALFLTQIGHRLSDGEPHDDRAPDYDDWRLDGDLLFYYPVLGRAFEVTSMGIRVDADSLREQCRLSGREDRLDQPYHRQVLAATVPYTIGGGLGQSRICMFLLAKAHLGEVQASTWTEETARACEKAGIVLL